MRGASKLPVKNILKGINPIQATSKPGAMAISTPSQQEKNNDHGAVVVAMNNNIEPLVAFNKPRLPPVLGPLVLLSLLEMGSSSDGNDN